MNSEKKILGLGDRLSGIKSRDKGYQIDLSERELREQVRDMCGLFGWKFHFTWLAIHSPKGFPDLVLRKPPRIIYAEIKTEKGKLTPAQEEWQVDLKACGQETYVWRPSQFTEIISILRGL